MTIEKPNWLYKPVSVDNLEAIQVELLPILYNVIPDFDNAFPTFKFISRNEIEKSAPLYSKFIESFGILDKWERSVIVTTNFDHKFPIHVDHLDWKARAYGLNIPLINCDDTYTVFYDAEINMMPVNNKAHPENFARIIKKNSIATEIGRFPSSQPAWVNNSIPHTPVSKHNKPRALISARFEPEVHYLFNK